MADLWADNVAPSLHRIEFGYRADPTDKRGNPEHENARADGMFVYGGFGGYIEIKSSRGLGWDMKGWRDDQREWFAKWCVPQNIPLFIWIFMGGSSDRALPNIRLDVAKSAYPRMAWLVPATVVQDVHRITKEKYGQDTLPYHARKGINTEMQRDSWDALTVFKEYQLTWLGEKKWDVKPWMLLASCANKSRQTIARDVDYGYS